MRDKLRTEFCRYYQSLVKVISVVLCGYVNTVAYLHNIFKHISTNLVKMQWNVKAYKVEKVCLLKKL